MTPNANKLQYCPLNEERGLSREVMITSDGSRDFGNYMTTRDVLNESKIDEIRLRPTNAANATNSTLRVNAAL